MIMVQYLLDADEPVVDPRRRGAADDVLGPRRARRAGARPGAARLGSDAPTSCGVARESGDFAGEQFMQWFIKEQVEEVAKMSTLLRVVERAGDDALRVEEFLAREGDGGDGGSEPGMPPRPAARSEAVPLLPLVRRAARRAGGGRQDCAGCGEPSYLNPKADGERDRAR